MHPDAIRHGSASRHNYVAWYCRFAAFERGTHLHTARHSSGLFRRQSDFEKARNFWKSPHFSEKLAFDAGSPRLMLRTRTSVERHAARPGVPFRKTW
jgi:hypothetical protein